MGRHVEPKLTKDSLELLHCGQVSLFMFLAKTAHGDSYRSESPQRFPSIQISSGSLAVRTGMLHRPRNACYLKHFHGEKSILYFNKPNYVQAHAMKQLTN